MVFFRDKGYYLHKSGYWVRDERLDNGKRYVRLLHREVWIEHNGPIPEGHHIHHKDGNRSNWDIENLECLSDSEHKRRHRRKEFEEGRLAYLAGAVKRARATIEGKKRYSDGIKRGWKTRKEVTRNCRCCGKDFITKSPQSQTCSKYCYQKDWWSIRIKVDGKIMLKSDYVRQTA